MKWRYIFLLISLLIPRVSVAETADPLLSKGRTTDPTAKTLSDLRARDKRKVPLEVVLKVRPHYAAGSPIPVTIIVTNLFDSPLLLNSRLLVNHPRLQGELAFQIIGLDGKRYEIKSLITPLSIREQDFNILARGESIQRSIDLSDLFELNKAGSYAVRVYYHNEVEQMAQGLHAWKGVVWSEPVVVTIDP